MSGSSSSISARLAVYESPEEAKIRAWLQLVRTLAQVQRRLVATLAEQELTLPQFDVLATLRFGEGVTQQALAERLLVTKGNVCGLLDRLERLGWVTRIADDKDGRINRLHLTPAGRRKVERVLPVHDALVLDVMGPLSAEDVKSLRDVLAQIERSVAQDGRT